MENGKVGIKPCSEVIEKLVVEKKKENRSKKFFGGSVSGK